MRARRYQIAGIVAFGAAALWFARAPRTEVAEVAAPTAAPTLAPSAPDDKSPLPLIGRTPSGMPPTLSCVAAHAIMAQIDTQLVQPPEPVDHAAFGDAVVDWLDPHGLWSAAPQSPAGVAIRQRASALLKSLRSGSSDCEVALELGRVLAKSVGDLRTKFDEARTQGAEPAKPPYFDGVFELGNVKRPAAELTSLLADHALAFDRSGQSEPIATQVVATARDRYFPPLTPEAWGDAVLAAAVRAYVPIVDPHGQWAPYEEEASLYEAELEAKPPPPFWGSFTRTALGIRIDSDPLPPLAVGDLVLSLDKVLLGGMPHEQVEQLAYVLADERPRVPMLVLSPDKKAARTLIVEVPAAEAVAATREGIATERVRYGDGDVLVLSIRDVREDLGDELTREVVRAHDDGKVAGIVLDLRGNGGGSTDGAAAALGIFMPGAPLFPMKRRDGTLEIDRATEPPPEERWDGPVAAFVDGATASAAEMIAGALSAYHRGALVGDRTFGKGCAQEYVEDDADVGVLRLTTLVFALPDGSPLQRTGLLPSLLVPFADHGSGENEASLRGSPAPFRGPDVRDQRRVATYSANPGWPAPLERGRTDNSADVGPCHESDVCRGLRALASGAARRAARR